MLTTTDTDDTYLLETKRKSFIINSPTESFSVKEYPPNFTHVIFSLSVGHNNHLIIITIC